MTDLKTRCILRGGAASLQLSPTETVVLAALNEYRGAMGICVSQQTIENGTGIRRENVGKIIKRLADQDVLSIVEPGRQHHAAVLEITVRCDATSHLHADGNAHLVTFRRDATSHLTDDPDVTQRKHLSTPPDVTQHHKSRKTLTSLGLPGPGSAEPAASATSPREVPSSRRSDFESVQPQPPRRRPAA